MIFSTHKTQTHKPQRPEDLHPEDLQGTTLPPLWAHPSGPHSSGPLRRTPPLRRTTQNSALFFPSPATIFILSLSFGVLSLNIGGVFLKAGNPEMCTFGLSGCRVKPRLFLGRRGFTRQPEISKRAPLRALVLQTPPKFHEEDTQRETKRGRGREREKNAKFQAPHPSGPHPSGPHPFGPPPFGARFFMGLGPTLWGPNDTRQIQKWIGQKWIGQKWIGQNWLNRMAKTELAKVVLLLWRSPVSMHVAGRSHHWSQ